MAAILLGGIGSALGAGFGGTFLGLSGAVIGGGIGSRSARRSTPASSLPFRPTSGKRARGWMNCVSPALPKAP